MYACKRNLHPSYVTAMLAIQKKRQRSFRPLHVWWKCIIDYHIWWSSKCVSMDAYIQIMLMYSEIARRKDIHNWIIHNLVIWPWSIS